MGLSGWGGEGLGGFEHVPEVELRDDGGGNH